MRKLGVFGFVFLALSSGWAGTACSPHPMRRYTAEAKRIQAELLATKVKSIDTEVEPATRKLIHDYKDALANAVSAYFSCELNQDSSADEYERNLAKALDANKPEAPSTEKVPESKVIDNIYGSDLKVKVRRPDNFPFLVTVELSFGIECGNDTVLLVYQQFEGNTNEALRWQSDEYAEINGAFGDFMQYAVVPGQDMFDWSIAVAHGHPWCTSRWSGFTLDLLAQQHGTVNPRVLAHRDLGYVRDDVDPVMKPKPDGFELRLEVGSIDLDRMTRPGIFRYRVAGGKMERVQPVAMDGRDFVDAWAEAEWWEAAGWGAPADSVSLQKAHTELAALRKAERSPTFTFGPTRGCSGDGKRFQVELDRDPGRPIYFQIREGTNSFTMLSMGATADAQCSGPDLMKKAVARR